MFDERGGAFHLYKHGVTVIVPTGAIPCGVLAELKFAATIVAPVKFTYIHNTSVCHILAMHGSCTIETYRDTFTTHIHGKYNQCTTVCKEFAFTSKSN